MTKPTLTIITVCRNIKDEIARTCESIVRQKWQDFEWIVIDGASTDGTTDILKQYQDRINILISEPDTGIYNAMNKGIRLAQGEWINFMNGGDGFASENALKNIFENKSYDAGILYGNVNICTSSGRRLYTRTYPETLDDYYFSHNFLCHQSQFIKRDLFKKFGLYNENYKIMSDAEKNIIWVKNNVRFQKVPHVISNFCRGGTSSNKIIANKEHYRVITTHYTEEERKRYAVTDKIASFPQRVSRFLSQFSLIEK